MTPPAPEPDTTPSSSADGLQVAVVGGGIAGLTAAWELVGAGARVTVWEASDRLGGKLTTSEFAGIQLDEGPDAMLARVPEGTQLLDELGVPAVDRVHPRALGAAVVAGGRLRDLPAGLVLGIPTDADALEASEIVSPASVALVRRLLDRREPPDRPGRPARPGRPGSPSA